VVAWLNGRGGGGFEDDLGGPATQVHNGCCWDTVVPADLIKEVINCDPRVNT
jgi:hypothetical protein